MSKQKKKMILAICGILLLAVLYLGLTAFNKYSDSKDKATARADLESSIVLSLAKDEIDTICFPGTEGDVFLTSEENGWISLSDPEFEGDGGRIGVLTSDLGALMITRDLGDASPQEYGLADGGKVIRVEMKDGSSHEIHLGSRNSSTGEVYFSLDGGTNIYMTNVSLDTHFDGTLKDFAAYERWQDIEPKYMRIFDVKKPEGSYKLVMPGDANCTVEDAEGNVQEASLGVVGNLQQDLGNLNFAGHQEYACKDFEKYGLGSTATVVYIEYENGNENANVTLRIGDCDENGDYYVRVDDSKQVHLVHPEYVADFVESQATSFWSMTYSFISIGDMRTMKVTCEEGSHELRRTAVNEGKADEVITYFLDGKEVEKKPFTDFYYACCSVTAQERLEEVPEMKDAPVLDLEYELVDGGSRRISYYDYDQNFYLVIYQDGEKAAYTNKLYVNTMLKNLEILLQK